MMKILKAMLGLFGFGSHPDSHKRSITHSSPNFDQQLKVFNQLGFMLNPGTDISDLNRWSGGHVDFENYPFRLMYQTLGSTLERAPFTPLTNKVWKIDLEAIEDHGDYIRIMKNISRITNGELVFEALDDYVDVEESTAWVAFICNGDSYKWDLKVDNDWADEALFDNLQALTVKYHTNGSFTFFHIGGQDFVLGYCTSEELEKLRKATGLEIVWLKAKGQLY